MDVTPWKSLKWSRCKVRSALLLALVGVGA